MREGDDYATILAAFVPPPGAQLPPFDRLAALAQLEGELQEFEAKGEQRTAQAMISQILYDYVKVQQNDIGGLSWVWEKCRRGHRNRALFVKAWQFTLVKIRQPGPTAHTSEVASADASPGQRQRKRFAKEVAARDNYRCLVSQGVDLNQLYDHTPVNERDKLPDLYPLGQYKRIAGEVTHLIPSASANERELYAFLTAVTGIDITQHLDTSIDSITNGIFLDRVIHDYLAHFQIGLEPLGQNMYQLHVDEKRRILRLHEEITSPIDFNRSSADLNTAPSPEVLALRWEIFRLVHSSPAAKELLLPYANFDHDAATMALPEGPGSVEADVFELLLSDRLKAL